jgi:hypothetical protein
MAILGKIYIRCFYINKLDLCVLIGFIDYFITQINIYEYIIQI